MNQQKQHLRPLLWLSFGLICAIFLSLSVGYAQRSPLAIWHILTGQADTSTTFIISQIRLPRVLACLLGGASLALAGLLLQTLTKNPLADSGILGINTGAGFVIACMVALWDQTTPLILALRPLLAMLGGLGVVLMVYWVSRKKNHDISPVRLIITGVGMSSMLSGLMVAVIAQIDPFKVAAVVSWLSGQIAGDDWLTLGIFTPLLMLIWGLTYSRSQSLNIMNLNEQTALALGLHLQKERLRTLVLATTLAALSVVLVGNITFVGLVSGHITRRLFGNDHRLTLPASMLFGMLLLLLADTLGRVLLVGTGIPTGLVVTAIGAPYFLYLMQQNH